MSALGEALGKLTPDTQASGSMLPALRGINPYMTPNDCLVRAFNAIDREGQPYVEKPREYIEAADWGNKTEKLILAETARRLGVEADLEITRPYQHPLLPLAVSLDGIAQGNGATFRTDPDRKIYVIGRDEIELDGPGILEAKLTGAAASPHPAPYRGPIQVAGAMMCTGFKWAAIGTLYRGTELRIYLLAPEPSETAKIEADVLDFQRRLDGYRNHGDRDWYPALSPNDAASIYSWADSGEPPIALDDELSQLALEYSDACKAERALAKLKTEITTRIMDAMGPHEQAEIYEEGAKVGEVSWKTNKARSEYVVQARPAARAKSIQVKIYGDDD